VGEIVKERYQSTDWVLSEELYCLFCGHQGLWLGDDDEWIEHYCTACNTLSLVRPAVMELLAVEKQEERRALLTAREKDTTHAA